jgi:protein required for attachment to host cells
VNFAREVAVEIGRLCAAPGTRWVALVADPRTLAVWREHLPDAANPMIRAELAKDLTKHSVAELTRVLAG